MTDVIGQVLLVLGPGIFFLAGIRLFRFNDGYSRISAVATASGVGIALVTAGVLFINPTLNSGYPFSGDTDTAEVDGALGMFQQRTKSSRCAHEPS